MKVLSIENKNCIDAKWSFRFTKRFIYFQVENGKSTTTYKRVLSDNNTFSFEGKKFKVKLEVLGNEL